MYKHTNPHAGTNLYRFNTQGKHARTHMHNEFEFDGCRQELFIRDGDREDNDTVYLVYNNCTHL
jgi:hypothetical protein